MKTSVALVLAGAIAAGASPVRADDASAPDTSDASAEAPATPRVPPRPAMWRLELGYRGSFVTNAGYGPFSTDDYFSQVSVAASRTVFVRGRLSFAPGLSWDYGSASAAARGDATSLGVHRLAVPLEGRLHAGRLGYAFLRVAPGVVVTSAEVDDPSAPASLTKTRWLASADASAGAAWLVWSAPDSLALQPRLWLQGDAGYGWIASERLDLAPDLPSGSAVRAGGTDLGTLAMRGVFLRFAAAVSF